MIAILKHELKSYFHSLTAYVFGAFLLVITGVGAMLYNIQAAVSNFEYVLSFGSIVFVVIVPILTMRSIAEERKQKTDQLLYSLPITTTQIILGKYLALLAVFAAPMVLICYYPVVFSRFGDVYLPTAYGSLFAFFLMGAAWIAVGVFVSSLTENQGFAAGIGVGVILLNYYGVSLSEYVSSTATSSLVAITVLIVLVVLILRNLTKNDLVSFGTGIVLLAALMITYLTGTQRLEGLLPGIMTKFSLFKQFERFVDGVFDLTSVVFFLSVIVFFLFLSVQSLEKRRYN